VLYDSGMSPYLSHHARARWRCRARNRLWERLPYRCSREPFGSTLL